MDRGGAWQTDARGHKESGTTQQLILSLSFSGMLLKQQPKKSD